jgi:hypothetical protein
MSQGGNNTKPNPAVDRPAWLFAQAAQLLGWRTQAISAKDIMIIARRSHIKAKFLAW